MISFHLQVTFHDKDCAEKACENMNPIIDGRRANVNFAYLGAKPKPFKGQFYNDHHEDVYAICDRFYPRKLYKHFITSHLIIGSFLA